MDNNQILVIGIVIAIVIVVAIVVLTIVEGTVATRWGNKWQLCNQILLNSSLLFAARFASISANLAPSAPLGLKTNKEDKYVEFDDQFQQKM